MPMLINAHAPVGCSCSLLSWALRIPLQDPRPVSLVRRQPRDARRRLVPVDERDVVVEQRVPVGEDEGGAGLRPLGEVVERGVPHADVAPFPGRRVARVRVRVVAPRVRRAEDPHRAPLVVGDGGEERVAQALRHVGHDEPGLRVADAEIGAVPLLRLVVRGHHLVAAVCCRLHHEQLPVDAEEGVLAAARPDVVPVGLVRVRRVLVAVHPVRRVVRN
eukprot:gene2161-biopygen4374